MRSPAIHAALENLVETIRTSLMAEFLEVLRSGKPARPQAAKKAKRAVKKKKTTTRRVAR
jgi:hypothetical protein